MRKNIILLFLIGLVLFVISCNKDNGSAEEPPIETLLNITKNELVFSQDGGIEIITVTSNSDWNTEVLGGDWCSISPKNGKMGNTTVTITANSNDGYDEKTMSVKFTTKGGSETLKISQSQGYAIEIDQRHLAIPYIGGSYELSFKTNTDYQIIVPSQFSSWISYQSTRALTQRYLTFSINTNSGSDFRDGYLVISDKKSSIKDTIFISQFYNDWVAPIIPEALPDVPGQIVTIKIDGVDVNFLKKGETYILGGDIIMAPSIFTQASSRAISLEECAPLWNEKGKGKVYYKIAPSMEGMRGMIIQAMNTIIKQGINVRFIEVKEDGKQHAFSPNGLVTFNQGGYREYSSTYGRSKGLKGEIKLYKDADNTVIMHEIGHTMGLFHEHQRADRDDYLTVNTNNLTNISPERIKNDYDIIPLLKSKDAFDIYSLMIYDSRSGFKIVNGVVQFAITQKKGAEVPYNKQFSKKDISYLNSKYVTKTFDADLLVLPPTEITSTSATLNGQHFWRGDPEFSKLQFVLKVANDENSSNIISYDIIPNIKVIANNLKSNTGYEVSVQATYPDGRTSKSINDERFTTKVEYDYQLTLSPTKYSYPSDSNEEGRTVKVWVATDGEWTASSQDVFLKGLKIEPARGVGSSYVTIIAPPNTDAGGIPTLKPYRGSVTFTRGTKTVIFNIGQNID